MSLPTKGNLQGMDYSYQGQPFVQVSAKTAVDTNGLDYAKDAQPFWSIEYSGDQQYDSSQIFAYINGKASIDSSISCYLSDSVSTTPSSAHSYLIGSEISAASQIAFVSGEAIDSSQAPAYLSGLIFQYAYPIADDDIAEGWLNELNGTVLYTSIDEEVTDDNDYAWLIDPIAGEYLIVKLGNFDYEVGEGPVTIKYRAMYFGYNDFYITMSLCEGVRVVRMEGAVYQGGFADFEFTLTPEEKASITDWDNLYLMFGLGMS